MTIPLVLLLGIIVVIAVKWGKQKLFGVFLGVLFGLALATTAFGAAILHGVTAMSAAIIAGLSGAVR